jgi:signal transduction histidine kinase
MSRIRTAGILIAACIVLSAMEAAQTRAANLFRGVPLRGPFLTGFLSELPFWAAVAVLVPAITALARAFPVMEQANRRRAIAVHAAASLAFPLVHLSLATALTILLQYNRPHPPAANLVAFMFGEYYAIEVLVYFMIAGGYSAYLYRERFRERAMAASALDASLTEARLHALRAQLHPHFLFNTLNAIIELAAQKNTEAVGDVAERLATLLRKSLDDTRQSTTVREEVAFTEEYLAIEKVRFGNHIDVKWSIDPPALECAVPSLILQPLVENAVRHGVSKSADRTTIEISATRTDNAVTLEVRDNGAGIIGGADAIMEGVGIGNTRARLKQMYGDVASLTLRTRKGGGVEVVVEIPTGAVA